MFKPAVGVAGFDASREWFEETRAATPRLRAQDLALDELPTDVPSVMHAGEADAGFYQGAGETAVGSSNDEPWAWCD